jgi:hypothetical protein
MTDSVMRRLVLARAMSVEPVARALCPEVPQTAGQPFGRSRDRWRETAIASGWSACDATSLPYGLTQSEINGRPQGD